MVDWRRRDTPGEIQVSMLKWQRMSVGDIARHGEAFPRGGSLGATFQDLGAGVGAGRGVLTGVGAGGSSHVGMHNLPSLYWSSVRSRGVGGKNPLPTGGITRLPINVSALANVC